MAWLLGVGSALGLLLLPDRCSAFDDAPTAFDCIDGTDDVLFLAAFILFAADAVDVSIASIDKSRASLLAIDFV